MKKKIMSISLIFILFIGVIFAWKFGYLNDIKVIFKSEKKIDDQKKNQEELNVKSTDENSEFSTVGMNETYIAEKIFDGNAAKLNRRWQIKATDCHISRELDFDISVIEAQRGLRDEHKQCMDSNMNFLKDYYYVTVELDVTNMKEEDWGVTSDGFAPYYVLFSMNSEIKETVGKEPYGKIYENKDVDDKHLSLTIDRGETIHIILYYIVEDEYMNSPMYLSMYRRSSQLDEPAILLKETR